MARSDIVIDTWDLDSVLELLAQAMWCSEVLPTGLRHQLEAMMADARAGKGFERWFDLEQIGGRLELHPTAETTAFLGNLRSALRQARRRQDGAKA